MKGFLDRVERLLARIEATLPPAEAAIDWQQTIACRWQVVARSGEVATGCRAALSGAWLSAVHRSAKSDP